MTYTTKTATRPDLSASILNPVVHLAVLIALLVALGLAPTARAENPNILFVLIDDLGIEYLDNWDVGIYTTATPNIDTLAASGVRFTNAWSNPLCSPTRASVLTGRHPFRTGVGWVVNHYTETGLRLEEVTLPEMLGPAGYATAAFGKWHLGLTAAGRWTPNAHGFDHFEGILLPEQNPANDVYFSWKKTENGVGPFPPAPGEDYLTSAVTQWTRTWIAEQQDPWFAYVAYPSVHDPFHCPPAHLRKSTDCGPDDDDETYYRAMIDALDTEIGTLLAGLDLSNTLVIFASDNGSPDEVVELPYVAGRAKGTAFEGGVRVPLVLAGGPVTARGPVDDYVQLTDIFATIVETVGLTSAAEDSISLERYFAALSAPRLRDFNYTEAFGPNGSSPTFGQVAARDETYKLIVDLEGGEYLFNLADDPDELVDLMPLQPGPETDAYLYLMNYILELRN